MKRKKEVEFTEMLELPVKDLTLEHLQKLKVQQQKVPCFLAQPQVMEKKYFICKSKYNNYFKFKTLLVIYTIIF